MDLQDPTSKMSTTGGTEQGTVLVLDEPNVVRKKVMSAVTDSGSEVVRGEGKAGVSNLIEILSVVRGAEPDAIETEFEGSGLRRLQAAPSPTPWSTTWRRCASATRTFEATRRSSSGSSPPGAEKASAIAAPVVAEVREAMGFGPTGS